MGSLRKGIGYLTQSAMLFNDSVRENLIYGLDFEPTDEQIRDALEGAYATFVYDLPHGLETKLGDRGVRFSGGERQRIGSGARAAGRQLDPDPGRADQCSGLGVRGLHPGGAGEAEREEDDHRHRAPPGDRHQGRPAAGGIRRQDRRARDARRAGRQGGCVPEAVREPVDGVVIHPCKACRVDKRELAVSDTTTAVPTVVIHPPKKWAALNLKELWGHRELFWMFAWRDLAIRYKQTELGIAWAILQPFVTMVVFTLVFGRLAGLGADTGGIPYPVFSFAALLPWTYFATTVTRTSNIMVDSANLVTKVYFPRLLLPLSASVSGVVDLGVRSWFSSD